MSIEIAGARYRLAGVDASPNPRERSETAEQHPCDTPPPIPQGKHRPNTNGENVSHARNPGTDLNLGWVQDVHVNKSAIERRCAQYGTRRSIKKEWQLAWLLKALASAVNSLTQQLKSA